MQSSIQTETAAASALGKSPDFREDVSLGQVMAFDFQPLVDRMVDKFGWDADVAERAFEDTKKFLYLAGASTKGRPFAPPEILDEMWHNWILFTEDYAKFCRESFGRFIHHRPRRRTDKPTNGEPIQHTLRAATEVFGTLSSNWTFRRADGSAVEMMTSDCCNCDSCNDRSAVAFSCSGSTNCQDSDCHDTK